MEAGSPGWTHPSGNFIGFYRETAQPEEQQKSTFIDISKFPSESCAVLNPSDVGKFYFERAIINKRSIEGKDRRPNAVMIFEWVSYTGQEIEKGTVG